jgi:uncharacterized protein (TIGR02147 family)
MKSHSDISTNIYDYVDYRSFLNDLTKELKQKRAHFNHSNIAKWAGLKSPGYLKMIIDGKRNLTADMMARFCEVLHIDGRERRYFEALVLYNQEENPDRKKRNFEELSVLAPRVEHYEIKKAQHKYFTKAYYPCVREIVTLKDFKEDYDWIAKRCLPPIKVSEAKDAISTLLELGLLARDKKGHLVQTDSFVRTEDFDTQAVEAYHAHDEILTLSREALIHVPQADRNFYAMTLSLPQEKFKEIIEKFYHFRDEIVGIIDQTKAGQNDEVYQVNFQFFPRTKT